MRQIIPCWEEGVWTGPFTELPDRDFWKNAERYGDVIPERPG
jgi:hypothetical protein